MSVKLFVSYAHKDEQYKEDLEEHLSPLIRSNLIESWHDRKIMPGDEWKSEIDSNLANADIILFLVSSSFISSDYCQTIEVKTAIDQHNAGQSILIPVVIRTC
ncbi:toll/interleukin-1 receptor domain-containing protein, partial [Psychrobacter sp. DAB_AL32B]|uniref:toll/interleukin-1 receptor domain-containing protein n=1 Tax=Psychrobacter sp. DAB_AL32B TaxID=1028414 RepID=UPI000B9D320E